jgi:hypothetical protein
MRVREQGDLRAGDAMKRTYEDADQELIILSGPDAFSHEE